MIYLSKDDFKRLGVDFAVANTPSFVYERFKNDPKVKSLALRKADELLDIVRRADSAEARVAEDQVEGYAAAVALLLSEHASMLNAYQQPGRKQLRWLGGIVEHAARSGGKGGVTMKALGPNDYQVNFSRQPQISAWGSTPSAGKLAGVREPASNANQLIQIVTK